MTESDAAASGRAGRLRFRARGGEGIRSRSELPCEARAASDARLGELATGIPGGACNAGIKPDCKREYESGGSDAARDLAKTLEARLLMVPFDCWLPLLLVLDTEDVEEWRAAFCLADWGLTMAGAGRRTQVTWGSLLPFSDEGE